MVKIFRNYNTLAEYEADKNKPTNVVCFIKDSKVIYVDGIQYSYKQLDYLPPATTEAEALEYMSKIIKNAKEVGLIHVKPVIYWTGDSNTIDIDGTTYTAEADKVNIDGVEYYQIKLDKDLDNSFYKFIWGKFTNLIFEDIDTSNVTSMVSMFENCRNLTSLNLRKFNTSRVISMTRMFYSCNALEYLDVSKFDTTNVTSMRAMFNNCQALTSLDLSGWNTSNVTNLYRMFIYCSKLTTLILSRWNTNNITNMGGMFADCKALAYLDLSGWDISNVTDMSSIFQNCTSLKTIKMVGCSQTTIDKVKTQLATDGITGCTIVTE